MTNDYRDRVQVYSPIRPVYRPRTMASAATPRRILGQQPQQEQQRQQTPRFRIPGVRGSLPPVQVQPGAAPTPGREPLPVPGVGASYLDRMLASLPSQQPQQQETGGMLGSVVNSLPGKAIMGALNVLDYPRRAVVSTIQEGVDALNGGDLSFDDWTRQINDPTFGFGDVVGSTGNIWADRLIGFAGDVLLDPLTYVGGSSAISGTGRAARLGGATRAIRSGVDTEIAERLGKFGYSAINKSERQLLREAAGDTILDPGFYFKFPLTPRVRIPGTGGMETALSGFFGRRRAQVAGSSLGQAMRAISTPEFLGAAYKRVLTGEGDMPFAYATEYIRFRKAADTVGPTAVARLNALSQQLVSEHGQDGMNAAMKQAQIDGTGPFAEWTNHAIELMDEYGMKLERGPRQRYAPLIPTEGGMEWLNSGKTDEMAAAFKNEFYKEIDLETTPPHLFQRKMFIRGEKRTINGKEFDIGDGSIEHLNAEFARLVPEANFKLFDDNASTVMARYSKSIEDSIGVVAGLKALQDSKAGLVRAADDDSVLTLVENIAKTSLLNEEEVKRLDMFARSSNDTLKTIRDEHLKGMSGIQGVMGQRLARTIDSLQEVEPRTRAHLQQLLQQEQSLARQRGGRSMNGAFGRTSFEGAPGEAMKGSLEREFDRIHGGLTKKIEQVENKLAALRERASREIPEWTKIKREAMERGEIARIPRHLKALTEWQATYEEAARLAMDREAISVMRARVIANETREAVINSRVGDESFLYAAADRGRVDVRTGQGYAPIRNVRERRIVKPSYIEVDEAGEPVRRVPETLWRLRDEDERVAALDIEGQVTKSRRAHERERLQVLSGGDLETTPIDPELIESAVMIGEQLKNVTHWEEEVGRIAGRDSKAIIAARDEFERQRRTEQRLQEMIYMAQGHPDQYERQGLMIEQLNQLRGPDGEIAQARARYQDAQLNLEQAKKRLSLENKSLQTMREDQLAIALRRADEIMPEITAGPPRSVLPLDEPSEAAARRAHDAAVRRRDKWYQTEQGRAAAATATEHEQVSARLNTVDDTISKETSRQGSRYTVDRRGNVKPKGKEELRHEKVLTLLRERDELVEQLDRTLADGNEQLADQLQRQINTKNRALAKWEFNEGAHQTYVSRREDLSARLRQREDELSAARSAAAQPSMNHRHNQQLQSNLREAEQAVERARRQLQINEGNADRAFRFAEGKNRLSELLDEKATLTARQKQLAKQARKHRARIQRLEDGVTEARKPLDAQDAARRAQQAEAQRYIAGQGTYNQAAPGMPQMTRAQQMRTALADIDARDRAAVERIRRTLNDRVDSLTDKSAWELVPPLEPVKHPFAINERMLLQRAYSKIGDLQAGITANGSALSIDGARRTIREIEDLLYPVNPRQAAEAADDLAEIELAIAQIQMSREPYPYPQEGTALHKILMGGLTTEQKRGGAMDLVSRAKAAVAAATNAAGEKGGTGKYEDFLVQAGAMLPGDFRVMREMRDELSKQLEYYAKSPHPNVRSRIDQLTNDLGRYAEFTWTYKAVLDTGEPASDRLAAFILSRSLYKESRVLDSKIKLYAGLVDDDVERWAAIEHNRKIIEHEASLSELTAEMDAMKNAKMGVEGPGIVYREWDQTEYRRLYNRSQEHAREIERLQSEGGPLLGILDEDLNALYEVVSSMIEDIDTATSKLRDTRDLTKGLDRPFRKREQLEAQIPYLHGQLIQMRDSDRRLEEAINQAIANGSDTVVHREWSTNVDPIDWTIEEAERNIASAPRHMQPELQRKLKMAKDRRARAHDVKRRQALTSEPRIQMARPGPGGDELTMTVAEARERLASNAAAGEKYNDALHMWQVQLSVLDGTGAEDLAWMQRLLKDDLAAPEQRAEIAERLKATNNELRARTSQRPNHRMTEAEERKYMGNLERIGFLESPGGLPAQTWSDYNDEVELLTKAISDYKALHADQEEYIASIIDGGNKWFDDLIRGEREPEPEDLEMLIELLGGEAGQYANTWVRTLKNALPGPGYGTRTGLPGATPVRPRDVRPLSLDDLQMIIREIQFTLGDTTIGERMAQRASALVTETGEVGEEVLAGMRDELYMSLISTVNRERTERIVDLGATLKDLGFEFFVPSSTAIPMPGVPQGKVRANLTLDQKMSALGYTQSKQRFSPAKLRLYLLQRFEEMGYDVKRSLEGQLNDLQMRSNRLDTMRRGLGGQVNIHHLSDPEGFHRAMARGAELNAAEDIGNVANDADVFRRLGVPETVEEAYNQRSVALQENLARAVASNDGPAINEAMDLIEQFNAGSALPSEVAPLAPEAEALPPTAAPTPEAPTPEAPVPAAPAPPAPVFDEMLEGQRTQIANQRDAARAEAVLTQRRITQLETQGAPTTGAPTDNPIEELNQLVIASHPGLPEGAYLQAHLETTKAEIIRLLAIGGDNRTAEETAKMKQLQGLMAQQREHLWRQEPPESRQRAIELGRQFEAMIEGQDVTDAVVQTSDELVALRTKLDELNASAEGFQAQLDSLPAAPATLPTPPGSTAPVVAESLPAEPPSSVTQTDAALEEEGFASPDAAPDELPSKTRDTSIPDEELSYDDLRYEHRMLVREFEQMSRDYGGMANAPASVQAEMGAMSSRIRKLHELQEAKARFAIREDVDWERYNRLRQGEPREVVFDWRNVLMHGTPSVQVTRTLMKGHMADAARKMSGARVGLSAGRLHAGSIPSQLAAQQARLAPMEALRDRLIAAGREAASQSAADRAAIGTLEEQVEAGAAQIAATRERLTAEAAAPSPEYAAAAAGESAANQARITESMQLQNQRAALQMERLRAEQQYTDQLTNLDMQLGTIREEITRVAADHQVMIAKRKQFADALETVPSRENSRQMIDDLRELNEWRRGRPSAAGPTADLGPLNQKRVAKGAAEAQVEANDIDFVETLLQEAMKSLQRLEVAGFNDNLATRRLKEFADGSRKIGPVMEKVVIDAFKPIARNVLNGPDAVVIAKDLAKVVERVSRFSADPKTWKLIDKFTAFFKTYATAKPGFHVRNAISGVFMNLVDNVRLREMAAAPMLWKSFMNDPIGSWEKMGNQVLNANTGATMRDAFVAVFGSGAGGQFMEYGVGTATSASSKAYQLLMNNALTRWNRKAGSYVEGPLRLAMAVDGLRKGMDLEAALDRVIKFHFNYNQVSTFDRTAKRYIPFWTFMSRNLPLQIEQMWLRPQMYLKYQSLVRNLSEAGDPFTPEYWLAQGAFTTDPNAAETESPWYLAPDLPHLRVAEPFEAIARGDIGKAVLSDVNPLFLAPAEAFAFNRKAYTGAPVEENYQEPSAAMKALMPLFALLGGTETGGTSGQRLLDDRYAHVARSINPALDFVERLTDQRGTRAGRQDETMLRTMGLPVLQLTPELRASTAKSQYYTRRNERLTQAELARM